jgi:hypothetical protein
MFSLANCRLIIGPAAVLVLFSAGLAQAQKQDTDAPRPKPVTPRKAADLEASIQRGVQFLLADQNKDGSWGSAEKTKGLNIYAPVPGAHQAFRAAVTAMCVMALLETKDASPEVQKSIDRGEAWLYEHLPKVRRGSPDALYNVWAHGYGIQALVALHHRHAGNTAAQSKIRPLIEQQFDMLKRNESIDGGWGYYDFRAGTKHPAASSTSFVNAAILIALREAKDIGVEPPEKLVRRAIESTVRQRKPDDSYLYGEYLWKRPQREINRPGGSLGRTQACNAALRMWGDEHVTDEIIDRWLARLFARNLWLDIGRKRPIPHESHFQVAGYFYYFGHYYAGRCIELLPPEMRSQHQDQLAAIFLRLQERDGSWWDYPLYNYHQQYGTAFAIMTLVRCR